MSRQHADLLAEMNNAIRDIDTEPALLSSQNRPVCIVGLPRSGTTLAVQLMVSELEVGWISNIAARFWSNPALGAYLHKQLENPQFTSSMASALGQTSGALEPHEFGRFWLDALQLDLLSLDPQDRPIEIDVAGLVSDLRKVANVFGKPVVYKSFVVPIVIEQLVAQIPDMLIVRVQRPLVDVAASLLRAQQQAPHNEDDWLGVRPTGWRQLGQLSLIERIAHQVVEVEKIYDELLGSLAPHNVMHTDYTTLATEPERFIASMVENGLPRRPASQPDPPTDTRLDEDTMQHLAAALEILTHD